MALKIAEFVQETRREIAKVTWPTRKETTTTTIMIVVMALVSAVFFFGVDSFLGWVIRSILNMGA